MTTEINPSGPEKAALFILSLDEDLAASILSQLSEKQLKQLSDRADSLDPRMASALDKIFGEFEQMMKTPGPIVAGAPRSQFRGLAEKAFGRERAQRLLAPPAAQPIEALKSARVGALAETLQEEHPQVAAVIVAQLPKDRAAKVLASMTPELQTEIVARVASLKEIPTDTAKVASEALARSLAAAGAIDESGERRDFDGAAFAAGLLKELTPDDSARLLDDLSARYEKVAPLVREAMLTFEHLELMDTRSMQVVMREVTPDQLVAALKTASEELKNKFLGAISQRAAATIREDLQLLPPMRLTEVEAAQRAIVETATRLAAEGRITLPGGGSETMV